MILKIRLKTDFWTFRDYCLDLTENGFDFRPLERGCKSFFLPFGSVVSYNVIKSENKNADFILETKDGIFEGKFTDENGHQKLLSFICGHADSYELTF